MLFAIGVTAAAYCRSWPGCCTGTPWGEGADAIWDSISSCKLALSSFDSSLKPNAATGHSGIVPSRLLVQCRCTVVFVQAAPRALLSRLYIQSYYQDAQLYELAQEPQDYAV